MTDINTAPQISIIGQFVKDLSFENPGMMQGPPSGKPALEVSVDVAAKPLGNDRYECALRCMISAKNGEATAFVIELVYAGIFALKNIPQDSMQPVLLIEAPRLIFPFARRIIADLTRDGGYAPLMLDPIDFAQLYRQRLEQARAAQGQQAG
ncbi:MAG TPA: protein-export chaperone SecB [Micropepsaceae bacterium]|nr:protein-export chaperone SecB [Micropepsaceae bacterium]